MMFFQLMLLAGYAYAHALRSFLSPKASWIVHSVVACLILISLPIVPADSLKPDGTENLTLAVLKVLSLSVGAPFFLLSATGPLIQAWQSTSHTTEDGESQSPYRLYALSNVGSLLALVSYPFLFEPLLPLLQQSFYWAMAFVVFVAVCIASGWQVRNQKTWSEKTDPELEPQSDAEPEPEIKSDPMAEIEMALKARAAQKTDLTQITQPLMWLLLAMIPSVMLLATTNLMCQEIASVPFLWILPLSLYLVSFIICFEKPAFYKRGLFLPLLIVGSIIGIGVLHLASHSSLLVQIIGLSLSLFAVAMTCHGELEKLKPQPKKLTLFYLLVSAGGSLGGIFTVIVAPILFDGFLEYHLALFGAIVLTIGFPFAFAQTRRGFDWGVAVGFLVCGGVILASFLNLVAPFENMLFKERNEYGTYSVREYDGSRIFISGNTDHGGQRIDESETWTPFGYYCEDSGFAVAIETLREFKESENSPAGLRVGVLGLGVGSMLSWAEPNDHFDFFEINPRVEFVARNWFGYLKRHADQTRVIIGDGRIQLEKQSRHGTEPKYDLLAMDAFSSDSIPVHLLTKQCFDLYLDRLNENGILVFHISNNYIDLNPVIFTAARERGLVPIQIEVTGHEKTESGIPPEASSWVLVVNQKMQQQPLLVLHRENPAVMPMELLWTDDYAPIAPLLNYTFEIDGSEILEAISK